MAASLSDLPNELIGEIFSYFHPLADRQNLLSACSVSRVLCTATQPIIFSTFRFSGQRVEEQNSSYAWELSAPKDQLISFTSTIIRRPDLAVHVKDVNIEVFDDESYSYLDKTPLPSDYEMALYIETIEKTSYHGLRAEWIDAIAENNANAFTTLLLSQLPHLEALSFIVSYDSIDFISALAEEPSRPSTTADSKNIPLARLKELELSHFDVANTYALSQVSPLLSLPSLQKIRLHQCHSDAYCTISGIDGHTMLLKVTSIALWNCCLDVGGTTALLQACRTLEHFEYKPSLFYEVDRTQHMSPSGLLKVLTLHRLSLQVLELDFRGEDEDNWEDAGGSYDIGSLTHFTGLRHLILPQDQLPHPSKWPRSTQMVTINSCSESISELMAELAFLKCSTLPHLAKVEVSIINNKHHKVFGLDEQKYERSPFDDAVAEMMTSMAKGGIEFAMKVSSWELNYMAGRVMDGWSTVKDDLAWYNPDKARHVLVDGD